MHRVAKSKRAACGWGMARFFHWATPPSPLRDRLAASVHGYADQVYAAAEIEGLTQAQVNRLFRTADAAFHEIKNRHELQN